MRPKAHMVAIRIPRPLLAAIDAWIAAQEVPPNRSAVMAAALRQFLSGKTARSEGPKRGGPDPGSAEPV